MTERKTCNYLETHACVFVACLAYNVWRLLVAVLLLAVSKCIKARYLAVFFAVAQVLQRLAIAFADDGVLTKLS